MKAYLTTVAFGLGWLPVVATAQEPPRFESTVGLVHVDVAVSRGGTAVPDLTAADFAVLDNGVPQRVEVLERAQTSVHALLVLDTSASVAGSTLEALKTAAAAFLDGLAPDDRATMLTFSHRLHLAVPPASSPGLVRAALAGVGAGGGTALFDAAFAALALADRRSGRPVVLIFSDGLDQLSWLSAERLRARAREADAVVYAVVLAAPPALRRIKPEFLDPRGARAREASTGRTDATAAFDSWASSLTSRPRPPEVPAGLQGLADETGGRVWRAQETEAMSAAFQGVLDELRSRYVLRFEPTGVDRGGWHGLEVRLRGRKADIRARRGYRAGP